MSQHPFIQIATDETFDSVVLQNSFHLPVLVDFWADWCQPCRMLMPLLSKLAEEYDGKFLLAKVDTEANRRLAAEHGIRSLPTVRLYKNGAVADEFMGALPESQIRAFLDKHIPNATDLLLAEALVLLEGGQLNDAGRLLEQAAAGAPGHKGVLTAQARLATAEGRSGDALAILQGLDPITQREPEIAALLAQLSLSQQLGQAPDESQLRQRLEQNDNDSEARYLLALRAMERQEYESALELLLTLLRKDRKYDDGAAQKTMLRVFDLLGGSGELVARYRGKMFNALH